MIFAQGGSAVSTRRSAGFGQQSGTVYVANKSGRSDETSVVQPDLGVRRPVMFRVLLHNDNYTTMEFVVEILVNVFRKSVDDAVQIMLSVHQTGIGVAGVYPSELAETKISKVESLAKAEGFPLKCSMEPD